MTLTSISLGMPMEQNSNQICFCFFLTFTPGLAFYQRKPVTPSILQLTVEKVYGTAYNYKKLQVLCIKSAALDPLKHGPEEHTQVTSKFYFPRGN